MPIFFLSGLPVWPCLVPSTPSISPFVLTQLHIAVYSTQNSSHSIMTYDMRITPRHRSNRSCPSMISHESGRPRSPSRKHGSPPSLCISILMRISLELAVDDSVSPSGRDINCAYLRLHAVSQNFKTICRSHCLFDTSGSQ